MNKIDKVEKFRGKKARQIAIEAIKESIPRIQSEEEKEWTESYVNQGEIDINHYRKRWFSEVPGSMAPDHVLIGGIQAVENKGYDVTEAEKLILPTQIAYQNNDNITFLKNVAKIFNLLENAPKNENDDYWSYGFYNSLEEYLSKIDLVDKVELNLSKEEMLEKLHAAWSAQIVGGGLGTIIEGYTSERLKEKFGNITYYLREPSTHNDDILFELSLIDAVIKKGKEVTSEDIALEWVGNIEYTWSAEEVAFENIRRGIFPPESARVNNPWNEWIGAQMRGSVCGLITPGDPSEAAKLAWKDGEVSHINNGILGEIFNAVLVSMAWYNGNVRSLIEESMKFIPTDSQYYYVVNFALEQCKKYDNWEDAWKVCEKEFERYNWIHAYPNAAAEVVALYYAQEDFDKCMNIISMCGQDVDCNAGQIGTIYGVIHGFEGIDEKWLEPFNDKFESLHRNYSETTFKGIAERTLMAYEKYYE